MNEPIEHERYDENDYDDMLDEFGDVQIGSLSYSASRVLKEIDPIAYNCGFSDFQEYEYECSVCGEIFDDYDDAKDCCEEETEEDE